MNWNIQIATYSKDISLVRCIVSPHNTLRFQLVRQDDILAEFSTADFEGNAWSLNIHTKSPLLTCGVLQNRGLIASALCEVVCNGKVPGWMFPSFSASGYFTSAEDWTEVEEEVHRWSDFLSCTSPQRTASENARIKLRRSLGSDHGACIAIQEAFAARVPFNSRVTCRIGITKGLRYFTVTIQMATSHHDRDIGVYKACGGIDLPHWSVRSSMHPSKGEPRVEEVLSEGQPTSVAALEAAGLLLGGGDAARAHWLDKALETCPEPVWALGLNEVAAPGRLLGSNPLLLPSDDFLAWIEAAGLQSLNTEGST